jgi:hypothetical protein
MATLKNHTKTLRTLTDEQYETLQSIAREYGVRIGGYQSNHGVVLYNSERTVYGDTFGELCTGVHSVGRDRLKRIERQTHREVEVPWCGAGHTEYTQGCEHCVANIPN